MATLRRQTQSPLSGGGVLNLYHAFWLFVSTSLLLQLLLSCLLLVIVPPVSCLSFLFVPVSHFDSHRKSMVPIAEALLDAGHHVEFQFGSYKEDRRLKHGRIPENFVRFEPSEQEIRDMFVHENSSRQFEKELQRVKHPILDTHHTSSWEMGWLLCEEHFRHNSEDFARLTARRKHFDVVVVDAHFAPCGYLIAKKMDLPMILFATSYLPANAARAKSATLPVGLYPQIVHASYDPFSFVWRTLGLAVRGISEVTYTRIDAWIGLKLAAADPQLDYTAMMRDSLLLMSSASPLLDFPRPLQSDIHYLEASCTKSDTDESSHVTLDAKYRQFLRKSETSATSKGVILVAFGHLMRWDDAPGHLLPAFVGAFKMLPEYHFIFQYDGVALDASNLGSNVLTAKWLPQRELLADPRVVAFVSHMGYKSFAEIACAGKPVLGVPIFAEQPRNALNAERHLGIGESVYKFILTAQSLAEKIRRVATDPGYKAQARKISQILKAQFTHPADLAAWKMAWSVRHKDKAHLLAQKGARLTYLAYYSIDVIIPLTIAAVTFVTYLLSILVRFAIRVFTA